MSQAVATIKPLPGDNKSVVGFWIYLMTDLVVFGTLFATFIVLRGYPDGGHSNHGLFSMPYVLIETLALLTSSFTAGLSLLAVYRNKRNLALIWLGITFALGAVFLGMELVEFAKLAHEGNGPRTSSFLSAFFTLVGTHGLHILIGLLWMIVLTVQVLRSGFSRAVIRRLTLFNLFWHFLDIVWIFIFTIVYLMGAN